MPVILAQTLWLSLRPSALYVSITRSIWRGSSRGPAGGEMGWPYMGSEEDLTHLFRRGLHKGHVSLPREAHLPSRQRGGEM